MSTIPTYWAYFRNWLSCMKSCSEWFLVCSLTLQVFAHTIMNDIAVDLSKMLSWDHSLLTMKESAAGFEDITNQVFSTKTS